MIQEPNAENEPFDEMKKYLDGFIKERNWDKYRTPKNLCMALSVEVAELTEILQWLNEKESLELTDDPTSMKKIEEEMADILSYLVQLAGILKIDLKKAFWEKTKKNETKHSTKILKQL